MNIFIEPSDQIHPSSVLDEAQNFLRLFKARDSDLFVLSPSFDLGHMTISEITSKRVKAEKRLKKLNNRLNNVSVFEQKLRTSGHYDEAYQEVMKKAGSCKGAYGLKNPIFEQVDYKRNALLAVIAELVLDLSENIGPFAEKIGEMRRVSPSKKSRGLAKRLIQSLTQDGVVLANISTQTLDDLAGGHLQTSFFTPVRGPEFEVIRRLLVRTVTIKARRYFRFSGPMNRFPAEAIQHLIKLFINGIHTDKRSIERIQMKFPDKPRIELELKQYAVKENIVLTESMGELAKQKADYKIWEAQYLRTKCWIGFGSALIEMFYDDDMWPYIKHVPKDPADIITSFFWALDTMFCDPEFSPYLPNKET